MASRQEILARVPVRICWCRIFILLCVLPSRHFVLPQPSRSSAFIQERGVELRLVGLDAQLAAFGCGFHGLSAETPNGRTGQTNTARIWIQTPK
jgi:hypothetical protein